MESVSVSQDSQGQGEQFGFFSQSSPILKSIKLWIDVKNTVQKGIGVRIVTMPANVRTTTLFAILQMDAFVVQAIQVSNLNNFRYTSES